MSINQFAFTPAVFSNAHTPIHARVKSLAELTAPSVQAFLDSASDNIIGIAPGYTKQRALTIIAFASQTQVLVVNIGQSPNKEAKQGLRLRLTPLLASHYTKAAFRMDCVVTALFFDLQLLLDGGIDLLSLARTDNRESIQALLNALGPAERVDQGKAKQLFLGDYEDARKTTAKQLAEQAWTAWHVAATTPGAQAAPRINARSLQAAHVTVLAKLVRDLQRLSELKPNTIENEISPDHSIRQKQLHASSTRFKNRIQFHNPQVVITSGNLKLPGHVSAIDGRKAKINFIGDIGEGPLKITTIGKELPTNAESRRTSIVLSAFQQTCTLVDNAFFKALWLPGGKQKRKLLPAPSTGPISFPRPLNSSQEAAVRAILSPEPITLIQGPPGSGKTSVIACSTMQQRRNIYLVAQSNVAVKNIAEKLASVDFLDFKLIVSKEFHYDWHEHLYNKVNPNLIRTDEFEKTLVGMERKLGGSTVILCTLSMLSNPNFAPVTRIVSLETVIVDEASQIEIGDFVPMISLFSSSLRKMVFIGDDKQLPPYGHGDISSLKSVFEMKHLHKHALFLDTQYRMPMQLGNFIGKCVYNSQLKSVHKMDKGTRCCEFIDVPNSQEEKEGNSWFNRAEIKAAIAVARKLTRKGKSFRIITPYDPQRGKLEAALKEEPGMCADDKVFCVDSFQGNEDDFIILSLVRTTNVGFMNEQRRVNVMLTRCKERMTICTNRGFVLGKAKNTLVGKLARMLGEAAWMPLE